MYMLFAGLGSVLIVKNCDLGLENAVIFFSPPQPLSRLCTNPLPVNQPVTIQDGGIEPIYLALRIPRRHNACTAG